MSVSIQYTIDRVASEEKAMLVLQPLNVKAVLPEDRELLEFLQKVNFQVPARQLFQAMKLLALTGRLFLDGKQLVIDLFAKNEWEVDVRDGFEAGQIKERDKVVYPSECALLLPGPPHLYIKGISAKFVTSDTTWKEIKPFVKQKQIPTLQEKAPDPLPILKLKDRFGACADLWMDYGNGQEVDFTAERSSFKRQILTEKGWEKDLLETDFLRKDVGTSKYFCPMDKVAKSLTFLLELGWKIIDHLGRQVLKQEASHLSLIESPTAVTVTGKIRYQDHEASVKDVVGAFNRRERFLQLSPNTVGLLPEQGIASDLSDLAQEGAWTEEGLSLSKNKIGSLKDLLPQIPQVSLSNSLQTLLTEGFTLQEKKPSNAFFATLRPYQQAGLNWLHFLHTWGFHGILADEMGLGKTVQVLAFLSQLETEKPILIVVPTSLLFNWQREIERFLPSATVYLHHGPQRCLHPISAKIVIASYTTLRLDSGQFLATSWEAVILDEAQSIKNPLSQTAQAVFALQAAFRLSITGTPIENHPQELWSQFRFLIPDLLGDLKDFEASVQAGQADSRFLKQIRKKIRPFILRRRKQEVAKDLPERIEQIVWVEMSPEQRSLYEQYLSGVRGHIDFKQRREVLEAILRLRQLCCHPQLLSSHFDPNTPLESAKYQAIQEDLATLIEEEKKVLVYSQFTGMLSLLTKMARTNHWDFCYLDGSTKDREAQVEEFQTNPKKHLFFISLKAGGVGLNLTAADYVLLYDPWWNQSVEEQAIARAHRIGRKDTIIAKRYVTLESIEEKIMKLKEAKNQLIESILDDETTDFATLTEADFRYLLS